MGAQRIAILGTALALTGSRASAQNIYAVESLQPINDTAGGFGGTLDNADQFGRSIAVLGDLNGDGVLDLAVGAPGDDDGGVNPGSDVGAVWILFLDTDGTIQGQQKISALEGGLVGPLAVGDQFGTSVGALGDFDGDTVPDLLVGAPRADGGGVDRGALWLLFLNDDGTVKEEHRIDDTTGGFTGALEDGDRFGSGVTLLGPQDGDAVPDLAVGSFMREERGAVWVLFMNADATVKAHQEISQTEGNLNASLNAGGFGYSVAGLGDHDGDGKNDLIVGAIYDTDGGSRRGAVWILFLESDGTVLAHQKISDTAGGFAGRIRPLDQFGSGVGLVGDVDGDGVDDVGVGAAFNDEGVSFDYGATWLLLLNADGTVKDHQQFSDVRAGMPCVLSQDARFGSAVVGLGDLDGDGVADLAAGAPHQSTAGPTRGTVFVMFLDDTPPPAQIGIRYCDPAVPNSTGESGTIGVWGSLDIGDDCLNLSALLLPTTGNLGYFIMGDAQQNVLPPGSAGPLCVGGVVQRIRPPNGNTNELAGGFKRAIGTSGPQSSVITSGSTWNFQAWHRDGGGPSNFTDAISVTFD